MTTFSFANHRLVSWNDWMSHHKENYFIRLMFGLLKLEFAKIKIVLNYQIDKSMK